MNNTFDTPPPDWKPIWPGQSWAKTPDHWPRDVKHVSIDEMMMGISDTGGLFWNGQPVEVGRKLTRLQAVYGVIAFIIAAVGAAAAVVSAYAYYAQIGAAGRGHSLGLKGEDGMTDRVEKTEPPLKRPVNAGTDPSSRPAPKAPEPTPAKK